MVDLDGGPKVMEERDYSIEVPAKYFQSYGGRLPPPLIPLYSVPYNKII